MKVSTIDELEVEIERLQQRIADVKSNGFKTTTQHRKGEWVYFEDADNYKSGNHQTGALKRAALDLKNVLTKVSQNR